MRFSLEGKGRRRPRSATRSNLFFFLHFLLLFFFFFIPLPDDGLTGHYAFAEFQHSDFAPTSWIPAVTCQSFVIYGLAMNAPFYERPSYVNTSEVYGLSKEPGEDLRQISRIVIRGDITGYIRIFLRRQIYYGYILRRRVESVRRVRNCLSFNNLFFIFLFYFFGGCYLL